MKWLYVIAVGVIDGMLVLDYIGAKGNWRDLVMMVILTGICISDHRRWSGQDPHTLTTNTKFWYSTLHVQGSPEGRQHVQGERAPSYLV